jgi:hypothetical protein
VSSVAEGRGIQYSAEAAGEPGNLCCRVIRLWLAPERRAQYSIFVGNGTDADAQGEAFVFDAADGTQRTILQTIVGQCSDFSTSVCLELTPAGMMPELRVALNSSAGTQFTLVVPGLAAGDGFDARPSGNGRIALRAGSGALAKLPVVRSVHTPPAAPFVTPVHRRASTVREVTAQPSRPRASPAATPMLLFFAALLGAIGYFIARPQVLSLAVPSGAVAGTTVAVAYRATGLGTAGYTVLGPDGRTVAQGPLPLGAGSFSLLVPQAAAAQAYLVRLHVGNPLADAVAEDYLRVEAPATPAPAPARPKRHAVPPPPAPPQIRSLALDRATLASAETLNVYYDVAATSGSIALFDPELQITYQKSELSASGHATFVAPHVDAVRFLTVVASVQRGSAVTESRIGVTVTPAVAPAALGDGVGDTPAGPADDTALTAPSSATGIVTPATVRSGQPVRVAIRGAAAGLELTLIDGSGRELARRDLQAGQRSVDFTAPVVTKPTRFVFEATYPNGVGSETVVRTIEVTP